MSFPLVTCVLALMLTVAGTARQAPVAAQSHGAYIALGDSIAFGTGSSLPVRRGYPALLKPLLETHLSESIAVYNLAVPGETAATFNTEGQLERFITTVESLQQQAMPIELVTVTLGGNEMLAQRSGDDIERRRALDTFREQFQQALGQIRFTLGDDPDIVVTTYYDLSEGDQSVESSDAWWIEQFNQVIRETAERQNAVIAELGDAFRGQIEALTLAPYDVHPQNQGYQAIARRIWAALAWDTQAPEIRMLSSTTASRPTPTLQFEVFDAVDVATITVEVDDGEPQKPVDIGMGKYVLLLDFRDATVQEHTIVIEASDSAGNTTRLVEDLILDTN